MPAPRDLFGESPGAREQQATIPAALSKFGHFYFNIMTPHTLPSDAMLLVATGETFAVHHTESWWRNHPAHSTELGLSRFRHYYVP